MKKNPMSGVLKGLKVLDFTTMLPGPYATMILADLGADVLRVLTGSRPDPTFILPPIISGTNISAAAAYLGRSKRSITINLKDQRASEIIRRLIQKYDVIVEQFRPGVMKKLDLDYPSLKKSNSHIIYCSITGYGQTGPLRSRAGHDINYLARSGIMSYSGRKNAGPTLMGVQIADVACGAQNAVIGILAAVNYRMLTGKGQYLDVSMTDGAQAMHAVFGAGFLTDGRDLVREGTILNGSCLYDFYETKDGRHLSLGALEPVFFNNFCKAVGRPDLIATGIDPADGGRIKEELRRLFRTRTMKEWINHFAGLDVCVEPVLTMSEVAANEQTKVRQMIVDVPLPDDRKVRQFAHPVKYSITPPQYQFAGHLAGADSRDVLLDFGYTEEEIAVFKKSDLLD